MSGGAQAHPVDRLPDLLLGELSGAEAEQVLAHIAGCADCTASWAELQGAGDLLADDAPRQDPPVAVRDRLMAQVTRDAPRRRAPTRRWLPAAAVLAGAVAASVLWLSLAASPTPGSRLAALRGPHGMGGSVYMDTSLHRATMKVWSLPRLPQGMVYEVWWNRAGTHTMGGSFGVDGRGNALLTLTIPQDWQGATSIAVTEEPAPGTQRPTGDVLIAGVVTGSTAT